MKVLWLINIMLPAYAVAKKQPYSVREGWVSGLYDQVQRHRDAAGAEQIVLGICFPSAKNTFREVIDGVTFYGFKEDLQTPEKYDRGLEKRFARIIADFQPDIVHVFGTEFPHALAFVRAFEQPERTLIGIQGICTDIAREYRADLPESVWSRTTFRDVVRRDSLRQQQEKFRVRGVRERSALLLAAHITGRTDYDREFVRRLCPRATYYPMNETMRAPFYEGEWRLESAVPHSLFLSQGDVPLKGLHFVLRAMPYLIAHYPDFHLYVAGNPVFETHVEEAQAAGRGRGIKKRVPEDLKVGAYGEYLSQLVEKGLEEHVTFLGLLDAEGMRNACLRAHAVICASVVENSPNSVCEAMLLGVPVIASETGGIPSLIADEQEGLLFKKTSVKELQSAVQSLFDDPALCARLGAAARRRALVTHDPEANYRRLCEIYREIAEQPVAYV
ncbi:MAG: glycosyltransferase family 4 protein [Lachnospiraceae bacterium]|nr:glycosyltransferase family 4 protein [Lachnospiraceae bacterium]